MWSILFTTHPDTPRKCDIKAKKPCRLEVRLRSHALEELTEEHYRWYFSLAHKRKPRSPLLGNEVVRFSLMEQTIGIHDSFPGLKGLWYAVSSYTSWLHLYYYQFITQLSTPRSSSYGLKRRCVLWLYEVVADFIKFYDSHACKGVWDCPILEGIVLGLSWIYHCTISRQKQSSLCALLREDLVSARWWTAAF